MTLPPGAPRRVGYLYILPAFAVFFLFVLLPLLHAVWISFFATWCPPCQQEMPDFERVHQAMGDRVRFVGLDRADSRSDAQQFAAQRKITYDLLFDPDDTFAPAMGVAVMPTTLLVSPDGVVVKTLAGTVTADQLTAAVQEAFPA